MHLLIPFASAASEPAQAVLRDLQLPGLARLLRYLRPRPHAHPGGAEGDEYTLTPPHQRALAQAWGWQGADGALPFAALWAAADGIDVGDRAWGLMTPVHWQVGRDSITLTDPAALGLGEAESRALMDAARPLFESEGFELRWAAPTRWYLQHESLDGLPCASLDRVLGRNVDLWLQPPADIQDAARAELRRIRRLQNEFQMLLYDHPLTQAREARGEPAVNSFWLSGCGRWQPAPSDAVQVDERLREPLLAEDWATWADAWRALDAEVLAPLVARAKRGQALRLTLCGERRAQTFGNAAAEPVTADPATRQADAAPPPLPTPSLLQRLKKRWARPVPSAVLEAL